MANKDWPIRPPYSDRSPTRLLSSKNLRKENQYEKLKVMNCGLLLINTFFKAKMGFTQRAATIQISPPTPYF